MRYAFTAFDTSFNLKLVAKLHKNLADNSNLELAKRDSMSLITGHYFAEEFNSRILLKIDELEDVKQIILIKIFKLASLILKILHIFKPKKFIYLKYRFLYYLILSKTQFIKSKIILLKK